MIVLFEGPRCSGKSTISQDLVSHLKVDGFPAEWWKAERGEDPFADMMATVHGEFSDNTKLWVADRFHLSEYVNSRASNRGEREELSAQMHHVDRLLLSRDSIIVYPVVSSEMRMARMKAEAKAEPLSATLMEVAWAQVMLRSECHRLAVFNEYPKDLEIIRAILLDVIKTRWDRVHRVY